MNTSPYIIDNPAQNDFRLNRQTLVNPDILTLEKARIFDRCWIYAGHESEVIEPSLIVLVFVSMCACVCVYTHINTWAQHWTASAARPGAGSEYGSTARQTYAG